VTVNPVRAPYFGTPHVIPGRMEAEHYDLGGFDNAYWDDDAINRWDDFRVEEGVDIQTTLDDEGEYNIGYIENGEYLKYTVTVQDTGYYSIIFRVGSAVGGGQLRVLADDTDVTGVVHFPNTGSWQNWADTEINEVILNEGTQTLTFEVENSGFNLNYIDFKFDSTYISSVDPAGDTLNYAVFPNPVQNDLFVEAPQVPDDTHFSIFNNYGQILREGVLNRGTNIIDVSHLPPGLFYLVIQRLEFAPQAFKLIKINH
jgi:hypothetical protein